MKESQNDQAWTSEERNLLGIEYVLARNDSETDKLFNTSF